MKDPTLREVLERVDEVSNQLALIHDTLNTFAEQRVADYQRLNEYSNRLDVLERRIESDPPAPPIFRAPMPSLTSEERAELAKRNTESMRVIALAIEKAPKFTAAAIVVSSVVTGLIVGVLQSCH